MPPLPEEYEGNSPAEELQRANAANSQEPISETEDGTNSKDRTQSGENTSTLPGGPSGDAAASRPQPVRVALHRGGTETNNPSPSGFSGRLINAAVRRRRVIAGVVVGGGALATMVGIFIGFLAPFKLQFMQSNIDRVRMARLTHVMDVRSDRFITTLVMAEVAGDDASGKNRYFEAKGWYASGNPATQWYKDMRTSSFFDDLQKQYGIRFARETGGVGSKDRLVAIDTNGTTIDFHDALTQNGGLNPANVGDFENRVITRYDTNKAGRAAVNDAIDQYTHRWQIIRRHNLRTWAFERLGITKWRFFENTREKVNDSVKSRWTNAVEARQLDGSFIKCLLGGQCPKSENLNDSDNFVQPGTVDPDAEAALTQSEQDAQNGVQPAEKKADGTIAKYFAKPLVQRFLAAFNAIGWIQTANSVNNLLGHNGLTNLAAAYKAAEYASSYMTLNIITDNLKDGKTASGDEVNATLNMFNGIEQSDGYQNDLGTQGATALDPGISGSAYADSSSNPAWAHVTDMMKVNSDSSGAAHLQDIYQASFGAVLTPLLDTYNSTLGKVVNPILDALNAVIGVPIQAFTNILGDISPVNIESLVSGIIEKVVTFAGGSPHCSSAESAGQKFNCADGGGAVTQEAFLQYAGGGPLSDSQATTMDNQIAIEQAQATSQAPLASKFFALDGSDSVLGRTLFVMPATPQEAGHVGQVMVASMMNPASFINIYVQLKNLFTSSVFAAAGTDNMYGVKPYGPNQAQLDEGLYNNESQAQCTQEEADYQTAIASGQDPPTSMCSIDDMVANSLTCLHKSSDQNCGGIESATGSTTTPPATPPPAAGGPLPTGDARTLASQILTDNRIDTSGRLVAQDLQNAADGQPSSAGTPLKQALLAVIIAIAQKHTISISALESGGTGHVANSYHYSGAAVDINIIDGAHTTGRDANALKVIGEIAPLLPSGSAFGQQGCGTEPTLPQGVTSFADTCDHLHIQVPR